MCMGGGGGGGTQVLYVPYYVNQAMESPMSTGYDTASQLYGARSTLNNGAYGYGGRSAASGIGQGGVSQRPSVGGSIANIGSDAHLSNIPGAMQLLSLYNNNSAPTAGWF